MDKKEQIFSQNLLNEDQQGKGIKNPLIRFYNYRKGASKDIDRSELVIDAYCRLGWYKREDSHKLEPDTFFASAHHVLRKLMKKHDNQNSNTYYIDSFKNMCEKNSIDYSNLSEEQAKQFRYSWFQSLEVIQHYCYLTQNPDILRYIEATHMLGNFLIIPKGFGWNPKCRLLNESGIKALSLIEKQWEKYKYSYNTKVNSFEFEEFKRLYCINEFYVNEELDKSLDINFKEDTFDEIFSKMAKVTKLIEDRNKLIIAQYKKVASL